MTFPVLVLGLVISILIGSLFHVWRGGGPGRLLLYILLSAAGSATGQWLGGELNLMLFPIGPFDLGLAVMGSLLFLGSGYWLSLVEINRPEDHDGV